MSLLRGSILSLALALSLPPASPAQDPPPKKRDSGTGAFGVGPKEMEFLLSAAQLAMKFQMQSTEQEARRKREKEEEAKKEALLAQKAKMRPFEGIADVFFTAKEVADNKPSLTGVKVVSFVDIGDQTFVEYSKASSGETWVIDVAKIVGVRVRKK